MRAPAFRLSVGLAIAVLASLGSAAAQDYRMVVTNGTNLPIEYFYYSECKMENWLGDRLGSNEVINPGGSRVFDMFDNVRDCCRDMRAKFTNGQTREKMNVNVCRESDWVVR